MTFNFSIFMASVCFPDGPGPLSLGDGQFSKPEHVALDSEGKMYVVDRGNERIQVFAPMQ
jgi:hypothetical protein